MASRGWSAADAGGAGARWREQRAGVHRLVGRRGEDHRGGVEGPRVLPVEEGFLVLAAVVDAAAADPQIPVGVFRVAAGVADVCVNVVLLQGRDVADLAEAALVG